MNKKVIIAFSISFFLGLAYLFYRNTAIGKKRKAKRILKLMLKEHKKRDIQWAFPKELVEEIKVELHTLNYEELEMVEEYIKLNLKKVEKEEILDHREKLKAQGIYEKTELKALDQTLYKLYGLSNEYSEGRKIINF